MTDALLQTALRAHQSGNMREASRLYRQILRANPRHFQTLHSLALAQFQMGAFEEAQGLFGEAASVDPTSADAPFNQGCALMSLQRYADAVRSFEAATRIRADYADAWANRSVALFHLERLEETLASCDRALALKPNFGPMMRVRAAALLWLKRDDEALAAYDAVLAFQPAPDAFHNRADILLRAERLAEACETYAQALRVQPGDIALLNNYATTLFSLKRYDEAIPVYERMLAIDPRFAYAEGDLVYAKLQCCRWDGLEEDRAAIDAAIRAGRKAILPLQHIALSSSAEDQQRAARLFANDRFPAEPAMPQPRAARSGERLRIAYISANFGAHPVGHRIAGVLEHHDKSRFETIGVALGANDRSAMRARLEEAFAQFVEVGERSDAEIAALLRNLNVDIAVDLMGFTQGGRTGIFAGRPAPLQLQYLGYPGTMGTPCIDYVIADRVVLPDALTPFFDEKIVRLPNGFFPGEGIARPADRTDARKKAGFSGDAFVFCSFNSNYKITPAVFDVWMRLLHGVEGSVLWLSEPGPAAAANLRREAQSRGIADARILFAPFLAERGQHLARLGAADLFLDTLPYGGHSTVADALSVGLPVLTCSGETFAGRVAASLLHHAGLDDLVTPSWDAYEKTALRLARGGNALADMRKTLERGLENGRLFDSARLCRALETAYIRMWEGHRRGDAPAGFSLEDHDLLGHTP